MRTSSRTLSFGLAAAGTALLAAVFVSPVTAVAGSAPSSAVAVGGGEMATAQPAQPFTLEQVLSYSFPTGLVTAPTGQRIAWMADTEGRRNVWVAEAPDWRARRLTHYMEDDGQELSGLAFTPDGERLIYLRGGVPNRDGELPNPTSAKEGVSRDLWMIEWRGGEPVRLAGAVSPRISPTDDRIVWASKGSAWLLELDGIPQQPLPGAVLGTGGAPRESRPAAGSSDGTGSDKPQPVKLFGVRSGLSDLRWSPDGTRLAFASARDGHAILGLYDLAGGTLRWLTSSADIDRLPRWSPDGTRLAFIRTLAGYRGFSVWTMEVASGEARELWRAPDDPKRGRYPRSIAGSYNLMYGAGQLVFPGEMSGWNHLYAIPDGGLPEGGEPVDLTPGQGIVENAALSADGKWIYVSTNTQSIDTRQLGRVRLGDGHSEWLESGKAIAWNPAPGPDGSWIAYIHADAHEPASVYTRSLGAGEGRRVSPLAADFPLDSLVEPRQVIFEAADGLTIHGQLFVPESLAAGTKVPAVIFMHGGSRRQMMLGWHNRGYYHGAYGFNQYLTSKGYVVLSVNYRSGIGYGVEFREPPDYGWRGASEYQDIVAAGRYLQSLAQVDPERIGLWGGSYGGYLTAMGLARNSDLFKAGVDLHGVHDWSEQLRWYGRGQIRASSEAARQKTAQLAFRSSPVADIQNWRSPVLIVQADDDRNVPFESSIDLVARLRKKGDVHFEELFFVDDVHGFLLHKNWLTVFRTAADFFDRQLRSPPGQRP
ncbi:MAG: S9 family peptidase [Acidobacteriota bacterium]